MKIGGLKFGFYYKQFLFFVLVGAISVGTYFFVFNQLGSASLADEVNLDYSKGSYQLDMEVLPDGKVKIGEHEYGNLINPTDDYDQFKYVAFSQEGVYLNQLDILVHLPQPITESQYKPRIFAVHGVGSYSDKMIDSQTIKFTALDLVPSSTFTVQLNLPASMINFPWYKKIFFGLTQMPFYFWILLSLIPLVIVLLILFYAYYKTAGSWTVKHIKEVRDNPPSDLSAAEASVIINDKIAPRAIASVFIDLAERGKINIVDHKEYFTFSKKSSLSGGLKKFESLLLSKIFAINQKTIGRTDIEFRLGKHIFSRKIAEVYLEIYNNLFKCGYFLENPLHWQNGFRRTGYLLFFVGLIGFILNIIFLSNIMSLALIWFTVIVAAGFLIKISPHLPARTKEGSAVTREWIKFKNFLDLPQPFGYTNNAQEIFEKYLSYAVAFGVEETWTRRFIDYPFRTPSWLITGRNTLLLEDLLAEIIPFVRYISLELARSQEPSA